MKLDRRLVLKATVVAGVSVVAGCTPGEAVGGPDSGVPDGGEPDGGMSDAGMLPEWTLMPITLIAGSGGTFDLAPTLPAGVTSGGSFAVDASGTALPSGMDLSMVGVLSVGSAAAGSMAGVVFAYTEP